MNAFAEPIYKKVLQFPGVAETMRKLKGEGFGDRDVFVAISGGVDSAVSAYLLKASGAKVTAIFMKNWEEDDHSKYCSARQDREDAESVAKHLGIKFHTVNFSYEYWEEVFTQAISEIRSGRTPNPDINCNRVIKFDQLVQYCQHLGGDYLATGHYVRKGHAGELLAGIDAGKDQSYFICAVRNEMLARIIFPLGNLLKRDVKSIARIIGLNIHDKKESMGICFIGKKNFPMFLRRYVDVEPGDIHSLDGRIIGKHIGVAFYTIGQRQGLGIGGQGQAWYIAGKDIKLNRLYAVQGNQHPALYRDQLSVCDINWLGKNCCSKPLHCQVRIRYRQSPQECILNPVDDRGCHRVEFSRPQRAVTPGQYAVFYQNEHCLGGGMIVERDT